MAHFDDPSQLPARYREQVAEQDAARARRRALTENAQRLYEEMEPIRLKYGTLPEAEPPRITNWTIGALTAFTPPEPFAVSLPLAAWGVNAERAGNWREHRRRTRDARAATRAIVSGYPNRPHFVGRVEIEATSYGHRLDPGSDLPLVKACVDGIVDAGVLDGDSAKYVARLILNAPVPSGPERIVLEVRPA